VRRRRGGRGRLRASKEKKGPRVLTSQASFYRDTQDTMGWNVSETGFTLVPSPNVPQVIRKFLPGDVDRVLAARSLTKKDIGSYIFHTGGPKVLQAMMDALELPEGSCDASWQNLREVGNPSSPSVPLRLKDVMDNRRPAPETLGLIAAMGPGFCSELLLIEW
jgi:alkylresorcinol/alkylpyrone synthase